MTNTDKSNTIATIIWLLVAFISIPYAFFSSVLLGAMIGEPTMMALFFGGSFTLGCIVALYYILRSINKKTTLYSKKGQKINVKAYIFIVAVINLIIMAMSFGFVGIVVIPWIFGVIFGFVAGFIYKNY